MNKHLHERCMYLVVKVRQPAKITIFRTLYRFTDGKQTEAHMHLRLLLKLHCKAD